MKHAIEIKSDSETKHKILLLLNQFKDYGATTTMRRESKEIL